MQGNTLNVLINHPGLSEGSELRMGLAFPLFSLRQVSMVSHSWGRVISFTIAFTLFFLPSISVGRDRQGESLVSLKALLTPFISFGPFFIAGEEGYFAQQGLEVHAIHLDDASKAIPSLLKGDIDIVGGTVSVGMLNMMAKGARMRIVADKGYISTAGCDHFALLARNDLFKDGKISDPRQLKGRRIAVKPARSTEYFLEITLNKFGLAMSDVTTVNLSDEIMLEAMRNRNIDLAITAEPWITRVTDTGQGMVWIPASQVIPDFQVAIILYGPNLIDRAPGLGKRFMAAYLNGVRQYNRGKTKRNLDIMNKHTGLTHEFLHRTCWAPIRDNGQIHLQSILDFQSWALMKRYLNKPVKKEELWDPRFVEDASATLRPIPIRSN